jgi:hypothetical protein
VPGARLFALAFTVKVTAVPEEDTLPEVEEGVSQFGTPEIEYLTVPAFVLSWYWNEEEASAP